MSDYNNRIIFTHPPDRGTLRGHSSGRILSAAMARQGLGLAFTYRSYAEESSGVHYLSIGKERVYLDLALIYPAGGYQSRATRALAELIRQHMAGP